MPDLEFVLLGDALWLEFINTVAGPEGSDTLPDPAAYLRWTKAVRVEAPMNAVAFPEAVEFRGILLSMAKALATSRTPPPAAIAAVNGRLRRIDGREQLIRVGGSWQTRFVPARTLTALEAVARSAGNTLTSPVVAVRRCANPGCLLFFADASPNLSRRWCSRARCEQRGQIERRRIARPTPLLADG